MGEKEREREKERGRRQLGQREIIIIIIIGRRRRRRKKKAKAVIGEEKRGRKGPDMNYIDKSSHHLLKLLWRKTPFTYALHSPASTARTLHLH